MGGGGIESHKKRTHMVQSHTRKRCVSRRLRNAAKESDSMIVCGRAFQSLGAELEKAQKPNKKIFFYLVSFCNTWNP